jgi:hypothetical protein
MENGAEKLSTLAKYLTIEKKNEKPETTSFELLKQYIQSKNQIINTKKSIQNL